MTKIDEKVWLPDWIIDEEMRRDREEERQRPYLEVPAPEPLPKDREKKKSDRGVVIIPI